jgi:hypothetical protein
MTDTHAALVARAEALVLHTRTTKQGQSTMTTQILSYGGGIQTLAMVVLVARGVLPRPDYVIAADTGREMPTTWEYADTYARPLLATVGLELHVASHDLATRDLYSPNGDLLVPVFTATGKLPTFCSSEWKARVVSRYARRVLGIEGEIVNWIGFSLDEKRRVKGEDGRHYPLLDLMLTKADCETIITSAGLPLPKKSRCYMCPHQHDAEWREVRSNPVLWAEATALDEALRENDERGGVWSQEVADLDATTHPDEARQCGFGLCFV